MTLRVEIQGLEELKRGLLATNSHLRRELARAVSNTTVATQKAAMQFAPTGKFGGEHKAGTSETRKSIVAMQYSPWEGWVATTRLFVDEGAKPHDIKPKEGQALTIPIAIGGRYQSLSKAVMRRGRDGRVTARQQSFARVQYRNAEGAPHGRHMDVNFSFAKIVHHPGRPAQPFMELAGEYGEIKLQIEVENAVQRAIALGSH